MDRTIITRLIGKLCFNTSQASAGLTEVNGDVSKLEEKETEHSRDSSVVRN